MAVVVVGGRGRGSGRSVPRWRAKVTAASLTVTIGAFPTVAAGASAGTDPPAHDAPVSFIGDFNSPNPLSGWSAELPSRPAGTVPAGQTVTSPVRAGRNAYRINLRKDDGTVSGSRRAELSKIPVETPREEHWYAFSVFLPGGANVPAGDAAWVDDTRSFEIVAQWHNTPDPGEGWTSPPLALLTKGGNWWIARWWDADARTCGASQTVAACNANMSYEGPTSIGSYHDDLGGWTDWVFHVRWAWDDTGIVEVFKNGTRVYDRYGKPNTTNDRVGVYFRIGIYKWDWAQGNPSDTTERTIYYDEVRVGGSQSGLAAVAPIDAVVTPRSPATRLLVVKGGGATAKTVTADVRLSRAPHDTVTLRFADPSRQVTITPSQLTFTPQDWASDQPLTISVDDANPTAGPSSTRIQVDSPTVGVRATGWRSYPIRIDDAVNPTGGTEAVSVTGTTAPRPAGAVRFAPIVASSDGQVVAFTSTTIAPATAGASQAFVRDRTSNATTLVSAATGSSTEPGNAASTTLGISADDRYVLFRSTATNLVANDTNGCDDIFVRDRAADTTTRVNLAADGTQVSCGDGIPTEARISDDGRVVAWRSRQAGYLTDDTNGADDVFVRDLDADNGAGRTSRVSVGPAAAQGRPASGTDPTGLSLSGDGRYVAFASRLNGLAGPDDQLSNVFVRDRVTSETQRVDVATSGALANADSADPAIDANGRYVAFASNASNLTDGAEATAGRTVFRRDRTTATTALVNVDVEGRPTPGAPSWLPVISADGSRVAFLSNAPNLVSDDDNGYTDGFVRDMTPGGRTVRVNLDRFGAQSGYLTNVDSVGLSRDGHTATFGFAGYDLVAMDWDNVPDAFVGTCP